MLVIHRRRYIETLFESLQISGAGDPVSWPVYPPRHQGDTWLRQIRRLVFPSHPRG